MGCVLDMLVVVMAGVVPRLVLDLRLLAIAQIILFSF
jgi:hypothetical protein